jgi:hypothetical protein
MIRRSPPLHALPRVLPAALALIAALVAADTAAAGPSGLVIQVDRDAAAPGEPFACDVTLTVSNEEVTGYKAPDFKGLRVLQEPQFPNRSTRMQIGGGQTVVEQSLSWHYELMVPPGAKGPFTIGGARVRIGGRELRSNTVTMRVGASSGRPAAGMQRGVGGPLFDLFGGGRAVPEPPASSAGNFMRAVADKTRVFVGEPVVVTWTVYVTQQIGKFDTITESRTDGFWSEDIPSTTPKGRLAWTQETLNGRTYQAAQLYQKALFPLREGKLTVTPLEAEIAQVDFFGTALRTQRLKTEPVTIEALPLPREGQPAGFDPGNVGKYELAARADRTTVSVGEAVTLALEVKGVGNVRNVRAPAVPALAGWKMYPPKENVVLDAPGGIGGTKTAEVLMLPERPGTTTIPALELATFDPEAKRYVTLRTEPIRLDVSGEAQPGAAARGPGAPAGTVENVLGTAIRPIRARTRLSRDLGATFLRSRAFAWLLLAPPLALVLTVAFERLRDRLAIDTRRTRRRRMRSMVRRRLGAAEAHREAGRAAEFYIEIERVLREVLAARLGSSVTGLRHDELSQLLGERGMPADATARVLAELEACDLARFAPGAETESPSAMTAALERADELIGVIEKAPLREGQA